MFFKNSLHSLKWSLIFHFQNDGTAVLDIPKNINNTEVALNEKGSFSHPFILMLMGAFSVASFAVIIGENPDGTTIDLVEAGDGVEFNRGRILENRGSIGTNYSSKSDDEPKNEPTATERLLELMLIILTLVAHFLMML